MSACVAQASRFARLLCAVAAGVVTIVAALGAQPAAARPMLIRTARAIDVRAGAYRMDQGIWIEEGRIRQIGGFEDVRAAAPRDIVVVNLGRAIVLPGLIDTHTHLLDAMDPAGAPSDSLILTLAKEGPARRALRGVKMAREMLEAGFTTVRNVGHSGIDGDVALRDAIRFGWVPGPRIVAAARKLAPLGGQVLPVQASVVPALVDQEFLPVVSPDDGRRAVLENLRVGADVIKVVADDPPRAIHADTMKAIVDEAHRARIKVAVHATTAPGIESAIAAGADSIEHGDEATDEHFQAMHQKRIVFVPTVWPRALLPVPRPLAALPNVDALIDQYIAGERAKLARARKAGVAIAFGSDNWFDNGAKSRGEVTSLVLQALESFGVSPADVLRSATVTAAELVNIANVSGTLEAGKAADLIAVDGDPLAAARDLSKVVFVMKGGIVIRDDSGNRSGGR
jgi:imidazolonepropionase-like amidohydrolase